MENKKPELGYIEPFYITVCPHCGANLGWRIRDKCIIVCRSCGKEFRAAGQMNKTEKAC